jgi:S1-C subfamily serine protease
MESGAGWSRMGSLFLAALVGGGAAVAIGAALESDGGGTTTVFSEVAGPVDSSTRAQAGSSGTMSVQEIYRHAGPGVLQVTSTSVDSGDPFFGPQPRVSLGSGFVISEEGYIVTNYHVIESARQIEVNFSGDDRVRATIVGVDPSTDLAVLKINAQVRALTPLPLGDSDAVRVGDAVVAIGNPFGLERTVTAGIVSALQREITAPNGYTIDKVIQTDAPINQGNSGGPLLNTRGQVIGVNSQIEPGDSGTGNLGIGFAVPSATVREVFAQIRESGKVEHAYLGVRTQAIDEVLAQTYRLPVETGVIIAEVIPGSPADDAGLEDGDRQVIFGGTSYVLGGDIVTAADGEKVASPDDLRRLIEEKDPGDAMTLDIRRGESKRTVSVTLGRRPITPSG